MDYQQIRAFLAIVDTNSVSKAADLLYVSQSSISKRLKNLENELGIKLIEREQGLRQVRLTPEGERFYPLAQEYQNTNIHLEQFKNGEPIDSLKVASIDSLNNSVLSKIYPKLLETMPTLKLTITTNQTSYIYEMINRQEFDLGFVLAEYRWPNVIVTPFMRQRFRLLVFSQETMDTTQKISPEELNPANEIFQPWGPSFQQWHEHWWPQNEYRLKIDTISMVNLDLFQENYWTIVPDSVAENYRNIKQFHIFDFSSPPPERQCYIIQNRYLHSNSKNAIETLKKILQTDNGM